MSGKYKVAHVCFYVFWLLLQVGKGLGYISSDTEFQILVVCGLPFAVGKILLTKWNRNDLLKFILLGALGLATMISSGTSTYLLSILCITLVKDMDIEQVLKVNFAVRFPLFIIRTSLGLLGLADMQVYYRDETIMEVRYALGYVHPNTAQFELLMLTMLWFILYARKTRLFHYLLATAYNVFIYQYTGSRTSLYAVLAFLLGTYILSRNREVILSKIIDFWAAKSWIIGMLFSMAGCIAYISLPTFRSLGNFSSRFMTAVKILSLGFPPLFGMEGISTDLGYVYILYSGGLILSVLFFLGVQRLLKLKSARKQTIVRLAYACVAIINIMEHTGYSVLSNGLLLYLSRVIYKQRETHRE